MIMLILLVLMVDFISKLIIKRTMIVGNSIHVIKGLLDITYVKNTGAAWSILDDKSYLVVIISGIIIMGIIWYMYKNNVSNMIEKIGYAFVIGGAIGNFIDRIIYGYVVDFIDFKIFGYNYPIFNLADIFIVVGVILLTIYTWRNDYGNKSK